MKKEIRNFITYQGERLVSIDIKNSQPFFSRVLLTASFWQPKEVKSGGLEQLSQIAPSIYQDLISTTAVQDIITLLNSSETFTQQGFSTEKYRNLVVNGEIYEYLQEQLPKILSERFLETEGERIASRDSVKREFLRIMNYNPLSQFLAFYEPSRIFKELFPF